MHKLYTYTNPANNQRCTIRPLLHTRTAANEVKCEVSWDDGGCDYIWFDIVDNTVVCQLGDRSLVGREVVL